MQSLGTDTRFSIVRSLDVMYVHKDHPTREPAIVLTGRWDDCNTIEREGEPMTGMAFALKKEQALALASELIAFARS